MATYAQRSTLTNASQWFTNGDHPLDDRHLVKSPTSGELFVAEGKLVRYYRHPSIDGQLRCDKCGKRMHVHGWIDRHPSAVVCPGDWIVTVGEMFIVYSPALFDKLFIKCDAI